MNYTRIYNNIIESAKNRILEGYVENHHILPKCLGGNDRKENKVALTAKEHYLAHKLLVKIYPDNEKLIYAYWMMCNGSKLDRPNTCSRNYEEAKLLFSQTNKGRPSAMRGKTHSLETKQKISLAKQGHDFWTGKKHSEESRLKQSISAKNRNINPIMEAERRRKISETLKSKRYCNI